MIPIRASDREASQLLVDPSRVPEQPQTPLDLPDERRFPVSFPAIRAKIRTLVSVAAAHGGSISAEELFVTLPFGVFASAENLVDFLGRDSILNKELVVSGGEVVFKGSEGLARQRVEQARLTSRRIHLARAFCDRLTKLCPWLRLVAISGSTAYGTTRPSDDIDFFVVTRRNRLWITLLFAMAVAKAWRMKDSASPVFCLNRVLEESQSADAFRTIRDALFAREALSLRVLEGDDYYREQLQSASWMEQMFPALYRQALDMSPSGGDDRGPRQKRVWSIVNWIALVGLAPYLTLVGFRRNARLQQEGNLKGQFRTIVRRGFFGYESKKYDLLRETYREAF